MPAKKIALVYDAIYPYSMGGAERRFYEMGRRLTALGFEVHLYGMKYWDGPSVITRDGLVLHGLCRVRPLYTKSGRRSISQALIFGLSSFKLATQRFDVIDCCGFPYFSLFGCKLAALIQRKPLNVTWHEVWGKTYWKTYLGQLGIIGYAIEKLASKLPDHIIAVSSDTAHQLKTQLGYTDRLSVIPNGVDAAQIHDAPVAKTASDLMYAGRLVDFKNVDVLIQAVATLTATRPDIRATIIGDGPMRPALERQVASLNLTNNVTFTGFIEDSRDVYGLMKASKIFVLPSSREGFGISVIEANAAGIPVITTNQPANAAKDLITEKTGLIVAPTPEALANAALALLAKRPNPEACRRHAQTFDWNTLTKTLAEAVS